MANHGNDSARDYDRDDLRQRECNESYATLRRRGTLYGLEVERHEICKLVNHQQ